ncbi:MAG: class I SAM-dependent methyltransferase [Gaiellaceae bacterium]
MSEDFDAAYFDAGPLRSSRSMTRSLYERSIFRWLEVERPAALNGAGRRALEIGCGFGYAAELFAERGYSVLATDISPHAIKTARAEISRPEITFSVWDATTSLPLPETFDLIAAFEVVEHLAAPAKALGAWFDLLKPGGLLLLTTPNRFGPASRHWRDPTHRSVQGARGWRRTLESSAAWDPIRIGSVQWIPFTWRLNGVMRMVRFPLVGAGLRILAVRGEGRR